MTTVPSFSLGGLYFIGSNNITIRAKDAAGNVSDASANFVLVTQDATPPIAFSFNPMSSSNPGLMRWTQSFDNVQVVRYDIMQNGVLYTSVSSTVFSYSMPLGVSDNFSIRAYDAAGNYRESNIVYVDRIPPTTSSWTEDTFFCPSTFSYRSEYSFILIDDYSTNVTIRLFNGSTQVASGSYQNGVTGSLDLPCAIGSASYAIITDSQGNDINFTIPF
ncbi:hypothetical protein [Aurantibacter sp.]|uniref:hypothetical protein n=1 Tax=Aurantibacter sp. TaxID=2807103 RepID=UPI0035C7D24A